jgi:hypothetical protein
MHQEDSDPLSALEILELAIQAKNSPGISKYLFPKIERQTAQLESEVLNSEKLTPEEREKRRMKAKTLREVLSMIDADISSLELQLKKRGLDAEETSS